MKMKMKQANIKTFQAKFSLKGLTNSMLILLICAVASSVSCKKKSKAEFVKEVLEENNVVLEEEFTIDPGPLGTKALPENAKAPEDYNEEEATKRPVYQGQ